MSDILIENPARILEVMVALFADFDVTGTDEALEIYEDRNYCGVSIVISDELEWRPFLERFAREWDGFIFPETNGDIGLKVLAWGTETADVTLLEGAIDYASFKKIDDRKNIVVEFQRFYDYNPRTKKYIYNPADITSNQNHRGKKKPFYCKYHTDNASNKDVISRSMFLVKFPVKRYEFRVLPQNGNEIDVGMVIEAPLPGLDTGSRLLLVTSKKIDDNGDVLRVMDVSSINEKHLIYYDESDERVMEYKDESDPECLVYL